MVPESIKEILAGIRDPCTETLLINQHPRKQPASGSEIKSAAYHETGILGQFDNIFSGSSQLDPQVNQKNGQHIHYLRQIG